MRAAINHLFLLSDKPLGASESNLNAFEKTCSVQTKQICRRFLANSLKHSRKISVAQFKRQKKTILTNTHITHKYQNQQQKTSSKFFLATNLYSRLLTVHLGHLCFF